MVGKVVVVFVFFTKAWCIIVIALYRDYIILSLDVSPKTLPLSYPELQRSVICHYY